MPVNSMYSDFPPQPKNPTDEERHFIARYAFSERKRPEDFNYVKSIMEPSPDITTIARPGEFKKVKVGVIGGGAGGMAAAFELRKLGFDITIFDAIEDRIGGRIYTYYFDEDKTTYGEFGAMRIPVTHETTWHYINLFKLNTRTFIQSNSNGFAYVRGIRVRNDSEGQNIKKHVYPSYNLTQWERNTTWQKLLNYGYDEHLLCAPPPLRTEILQVKPYYNPYTLYWDAISNRKMLETSGLSEEAINLISNFSPLPGGFLYNSYIDYIEEVYPVDPTYLYEIEGGTVHLPLSFYNSFLDKNLNELYSGISSGDIGRVKWKGGNWVTEICRDENDGKIILYYQNKNTSEALHEDFDYVVCAIPFSTLREVKIWPLFSPQKMQAIKEVFYGNALKALLYCKRRFWEEGGPEEQIVGGPSYTDLPVSSLWYPSDHGQYTVERSECIKGCKGSNKFYIPHETNSIQSSKPGALMIYNFNLDSNRFGNMPGDLRFEDAKREVEEIHGLPRGYLNDIAVRLKTVNWNREPWFRGGLCFFTPEQKRLFSYAMAIPEYNNRVFFAGEHVSATHRWIQGALQSGMEAANQLAVSCRIQKNKTA
jgi:monoamine oxidase